MAAPAFQAPPPHSELLYLAPHTALTLEAMGRLKNMTPGSHGRYPGLTALGTAWALGILQALLGDPRA